jgi:hypothetical protein
MGRALLSLPRHYMEVNGQLHAPTALPLGKSPRYPLDRKLSGPRSRSELYGEEKNLASAGNGTLAIKPVVRRYTD